MAAFISPLDRPARRQDVSDPLNPGGRVRWLTADSPKNYDQIAKIAKEETTVATEKKKTYAVRSNYRLYPHLADLFNPTGSWDYRTKSPGAYALDASGLSHADCLHLIEIPESYHAVVRLILKKKYFERFWREEEDYAKLRLADPELPRSHSYQLELTRPSLEEICRYHLSKIRRALVDLLVAGEWIDNPEDDYQDPKTAYWIEDLNEEFRQIDLGRQSHLKFSSRPGRRRMFGRAGTLTPRELEARANPRVIEYLALPAEQRPAFLSRYPFMTYLLRQAALLE